MTGKQLRTWRKRMKMAGTEAAAALGVSKRTYIRWEATEDELPRYVGLACSAISLNLPEATG